MSIDRAVPTLEEDREAEPPPSSGDPFRRPTRPVAADVHVRPTLPGVYPDAARERSLRAVARGGARVTEPMPAAFTPTAQVTPFPSRAGASSERSTSLTPHTTTSPGAHAPSTPPAVRRALGVVVGISIAVAGVLALTGARGRGGDGTSSVTAAPPAEIAAAIVAQAAPAAADPFTAPSAAPDPQAEPAPATPLAREPIKPRVGAQHAEPAPAARASAEASSPSAQPRAPHRPFDVEH